MSETKNTYFNMKCSRKMILTLQKLVDLNYFMNKSDAVRYMIRHYIADHLPKEFEN